MTSERSDFLQIFIRANNCDESATPTCLLFARYLLKWKIQKKSIFNSSIAYGTDVYFAVSICFLPAATFMQSCVGKEYGTQNF